MRFANPAGLWLLSLAVPVVLLYVLRPRRRPVEVSSTFLWRRVERTVSAASPWQRLETPPLFWLQLAAVVLLALAVARPVRLTAAPLAEHTVFILDASGSMAATDVEPNRLDAAKQRARELHRQLPASGLASLVVAGSQPRVVLSASPDSRAFHQALDGVASTSGAPDFATAFTLAESLETPDAPVGFLLLSDGGLNPDERRLLPPGTRYERVGTQNANLAVTRVHVEARGSGLLARVTVRNTGRRDVGRPLVVHVDGREAVETFVDVEAGATVERELDLPPGDRVRARLGGRDLLASDDTAYAVAGRRRALRVLLVTPGEVFLERLFRSIPAVTLETTSQTRPAPGYDLVVYDRLAVPPDPGTAFWAIAPPGGAPGIETTGEVAQPPPTLVRTEEALLAGLDLSEVAIAKAQRISAPGDEVLVAAPDAPLLVRGTRHARPFAYLAFVLGDSNLPLQIAFPILGDRLLTELAGAALPPTDLRVGQTLPVDARAELVVDPPGAEPSILPPGAAPPVAEAPGFWTVAQTGRPTRLLAVNPDPRESSIAPARSLPVRERPAAPGEGRPRGEQPLLPWVAAALAAVGAAELALSRRTSGVSRRQWRWAMGARAAIALLVAGALTGLALPRAGNEVATVFLIDASDSLGARGRAAAVDWVAEALDAKPADARAAVAFFGADARLELTLQRDTRLRERAVQVDTTRTNLAGALRLGAAVLPSDARRRIVVVSDGRITEGDAVTEVRRLREEGVRVDVHPVTEAGSADVAIAALEVPGLVRSGEAFAVQIRLAATMSGPARLTLERDGEAVHEQVVDVEPGEHVVDVPQAAAGDGVIRFRAAVTADGDAVPENDEAFAAVRVEGPPRVLMAEGRPGAGGALAAALQAGGTATDVIAAGTLPGLEELSTYASIVLVDVDVGDVSDAQVAVLSAAVRDLGRGLVTVGGERSFGLGGYLDSPIEDLLPVISDIRDPKRRPPVAQVLVIDSSGSMAEPTGGGLAKIDLARNAAARAAKSLKADDEVGILAFNTAQRWALDLQKRPADDVIDKAAGTLQAEGGTMIAEPLRAAGEALRSSKATRKHIILFSDGISGEPDLASVATQLAEGGVTVSAVGTGAALDGPVMQRIAESGGGRFYAARDASRIPQILTQEAIIASRNFITEGEFLPTVVSGAAPVRDLRAAPPILGYIATTPKAASSVLLEISPDEDPLLATWRAGLGRSTAWTSDASARWSQLWAGWDGYPDFWSRTVKDTFPLEGAGGAAVRARVDGEMLRITVEREEPWPDGASALAHVTSPDLDSRSLRLERTAPGTFAGELPAAAAGTYAVGAEVRTGEEVVHSGTALAGRSYSAEYRPGQPDPGTLARLSLASGGRGEIRVAGAFDPAGLVTGMGRIPLAGWLLVAAALLWPVDVALRRLALHGAGADAARRLGRRSKRLPRVLADRVAAALPGRSVPMEAEPEAPPHTEAEVPPEPVSAPGTLQRLLERKRGVQTPNVPD